MYVSLNFHNSAIPCARTKQADITPIQKVLDGRNESNSTKRLEPARPNTNISQLRQRTSPFIDVVFW
jgi:hypothetical protein